MGRKILLTGSGNIGSHLYRALGQNNDITVVSYGGCQEGINKCIHGDIGEKRVINEAFKQCLPEVIIHTAALTNIPQSYVKKDEFLRANCIATHNIIGAIKEYCPESELIYFSTAEIFGQNYNKYEGGQIKGSSDPAQIDSFSFQYEETNLGANNPYGATKLYCQNIIDIEVEHGLKAYSLICFNVEGPNRVGDFLTKKVVKYIGDLYRNGFTEKLKLGNIDSTRDWLYVEDVPSAIDSLTGSGKYGKYCLSSGAAHSVRDFIKLAFECISKNYLDYIEIDRALVRKNDRPNVWGMNNKIKSMGWAQTVSFENIVKKLVTHELN